MPVRTYVYMLMVQVYARTYLCVHVAGTSVCPYVLMCTCCWYKCMLVLLMCTYTCCWYKCMPVRTYVYMLLRTYLCVHVAGTSVCPYVRCHTFKYLSPIFIALFLPHTSLHPPTHTHTHTHTHPNPYPSLTHPSLSLGCSGAD